MSIISEEIKNELRKYISYQYPVGPANAELITDVEIAKILFDTENKIYKSFKDNPTILVGRRGSGKTAYLKSSFFSGNYDIVIDIPTAKVFLQIINTIQEISHGIVFPENTAEVWALAFTILYFKELIISNSKYFNFKITKDYLAKIGLGDDSLKNTEQFLWKIVEIIGENSKGKTLGTFIQILRYCDNVSFDDAKKEVESYVKSKNIRSILLIDSLDQLPISSEKFSHALSGLLKCVGSFNVPNKMYDIRFCLPAELYHEFVNISSNPLKDFEKHVTLHWHSTELLSILTYRLKIFAELYDEELAKKIKDLNHNNKDEANQIFYTYFPKEVENGLGFKEDTLAYFMRHTQLIPRQLICCINTVLSCQLKKFGTIAQINNKCIVDGVKKAEDVIRNEIFSAFKNIYPHCEDIYSRCIPELPRKFDHGQLQTVHTRFGIRKGDDLSDFHDFKTMLMRIGCIGRVFRETERYVEGIFDYSRQNQLLISSNDEMCTHPLFSCKVTNINTINYPKAIYPYGSNIDGEDTRNF